MANTYLNPVYPHDCADPTALYFNGAYWLYRTGAARNGRIFGILRSYDLIHWKEVGGAMAPLLEGFSQYWAPEVTFDNGTFYLYYAAGKEPYMHLRVATSSRPDGPFMDSGARLTREPFAIDPQVFIDDDGLRYLFYATDFLDRDRVGTGTVMDRLVGPFILEGKPKPVTLAKYDWQIYDPNRAEKGGVRWHTLEGPFVLKHKGRYYQMFSGGNYQNQSYGVSYAVSDQLDPGSEWTQAAEGEQSAPVLRTIPGAVSGPGHNSVVRGPDHRQWFCVYHVIKSQEKLERVLAVDRLEFIGDRLVVLGPSHTPQPEPIRAQKLISAPLDISKKGQPESKKPVFRLAQGSFLLDSWAYAHDPAAKFGFRLAQDWRSLLRIEVRGSEGRLYVMGRQTDELFLPRNFNPLVLHNYQVEVNGRIVSVRVDGVGTIWTGDLPDAPDTLELFSEAGGARFDVLDLTYGFEDSFAQKKVVLKQLGWSFEGEGGAGVASGQMHLQGPARLVKEVSLGDYEWVVNFRLVQGDQLCFYPALASAPEGAPSDEGKDLQVCLTAAENGWVVRVKDQTTPLPADFNPREFQQFRFWKRGGQVGLWLGNQSIAAWSTPRADTRVGLALRENCAAQFDLVRVTRIF